MGHDSAISLTPLGGGEIAVTTGQIGGNTEKEKLGNWEQIFKSKMKTSRGTVPVNIFNLIKSHYGDLFSPLIPPLLAEPQTIYTLYSILAN